VRAISQRPEANCLLVYAGSADDPTLEASLFDDLQIARPQYYLGVVSTSLNEITSQVMAQFDRFLDEHPVDVVIVVDDLASTMAAAITAKKRAICLAHLVAGTRSFDITMPKEINRLVIDALSDYLFTAGIKSNSVATREQQSESTQTFLVGNILMDTLRYNRSRLRKPAVAGMPDLENEPYYVLTLNRKALLADSESLRQMLDELMRIGKPVIAPLRGEARQVVQRLYPHEAHLHVIDPLSYLEFGWLAAHARAIVTDSGNVAEEATFNGVPCMTLNDYTEHQETVTVGTNVLVGGNAQLFAECLGNVEQGKWKHGGLPDRWDGRTAERIVQVLAGGAC
jgi:UDP-N-acetylglucosamine 2-epimerase (non-hydrolysing)